MPKEIASVSLDGSALQRVLSAAAGGEDVGQALADEAGDDEYGDEDFGDEDFGDDDFGDDDFGAEDFGEDLTSVIEALAGEDLDFGAEHASALQQLLSAAAGEDELSGDDVHLLGELIEAAAGAARPTTRRRAKALSRATRAVIKKQRQAARTVAPARPQAARRPAPAMAPANRTPPRAAATNKAPVRSVPNQHGGKMRPVITKDLSRVLDRQGPGEGPHTPLPLTGSAGQVVAANNSFPITVRPPKDFILTGLHLASEIAERTVIDSIVIEGDPIYAASGSIPGGSFDPKSNRTNLPRRLCKGGRDIVMTLRNISSADIIAYGTFWGDEGDVEQRVNREA